MIVLMLKEGEKGPADLATKFTAMWRKKAPVPDKDKADKEKIINFIKELDGKKEIHGTPVVQNKDYIDFIKNMKAFPCGWCFTRSIS